MILQNIFNAIGLCINIAGAYLMYHNTPKVTSQVYLYSRDELEKNRKRDARKNGMIRFGMQLLFIGFIFQLIALFL